jgi:hypothetical protein
MEQLQIWVHQLQDVGQGSDLPWAHLYDLLSEHYGPDVIGEKKSLRNRFNTATATKPTSVKVEFPSWLSALLMAALPSLEEIPDDSTLKRLELLSQGRTVTTIKHWYDYHKRDFLTYFQQYAGLIERYRDENGWPITDRLRSELQKASL